jgi:hypothetical protein
LTRLIVRRTLLFRGLDLPFQDYAQQGFHGSGSNVKPGRGEEAFTLLLTEMEKARRFGFTDQEFELAKVSLMSGIESLFNEENNLSSYEEAEEMIRYVLEDEPVPGLETEYKLYQHFLPQITQEDVFALAQNWLPEAWPRRSNKRA